MAQTREDSPGRVEGYANKPSQNPRPPPQKTRQNNKTHILQATALKGVYKTEGADTSKQNSSKVKSLSTNETAEKPMGRHPSEQQAQRADKEKA